ncbi:MAG: hypothetical protein OXG38_02165 [Chloroflexi bacterium]|nr:hypothetical protein [Chloroflexota bacterium]
MEWHHGVPEGIELLNWDKSERNRVAIDARMPDLIDTHVGQFVACFGDDQQFAFGHDLDDLFAQIPEEEHPTAVIEAVPARDEILIL